MWRFYRSVLGQMIASFGRAVHLVESGIAAAVFLVLLLSEPLGKRLLGWEGVNPRWAWLPIILVALHLFLTAVYDKYSETEDTGRAAIARLEAECIDLKQDLKETLSGQARPRLEMQYEPGSHFTRHPNGDTEVRILVRNPGPGGAHRVRVKLERLVPLTKKKLASPYSTQFNALRLQVVRENPGFSLHQGDSAEVILLRAEKGGMYYTIDGYDTAGQPGTFKTPRANYRLRVTATAMNAHPDTVEFVVSSRPNGEITFKRQT